jgi:hypothetical protein
VGGLYFSWYFLHVMQNYSKALSNQRRIEFRKADKAGKELLKGTHYLVLKIR